jgi:ribosomal protein S18 acetylase RimI-like enzyme
VRRAGVFQNTRLEGVDENRLKRSSWRSIAAFQRLFGEHAPDSELLEDDDFVASAVPGSHSSLINAALPLEGAPIAPHLDEIARFFDGIPKWGVWIDPAASEDAEALQQHGLVLDSTPVLMAAPMSTIEHDEHTRVTRVSMDDVGMVNDAAYGFPAGTIGDPLSCLPGNVVHAYGIKEARETVSVGVLQDVGRDAFVSMVATLPAYRGERLASRVLAHALHEAEQRGQETTSLQASKLGQSIYARIGYRPLGEIHLYERRPR